MTVPVGDVDNITHLNDVGKIFLKVMHGVRARADVLNCDTAGNGDDPSDKAAVCWCFVSMGKFRTIQRERALESRLVADASRHH